VYCLIWRVPECQMTRGYVCAWLEGAVWTGGVAWVRDGKTHVHAASPGLPLQVPGRHWRYEPPPQVLVSLLDPPQHSCHGVVEPPPQTEEPPQPQLPLCWLPIGSMPHFSAAKIHSRSARAICNAHAGGTLGADGLSHAEDLCAAQGFAKNATKRFGLDNCLLPDAAQKAPPAST